MALTHPYAHYTEQDAYNLGARDGREAAERGRTLSEGMTWDGDGQRPLNEAYDRGANDAQMAFVLACYPDAVAWQSAGRWAINVGRVWGFVEDLHEEFEAWGEAAAKVGRLIKQGLAPTQDRTDA